MLEPSLHWVGRVRPRRLALMARPRGGEWLQDEVSAWQRAEIKLVVSLLESQEIRELELRDEGDLCAAGGIAFVHFPIADRGVPPSAQKFLPFVSQLHTALLQGKPLAIHCRAGIGRTGLVAGCLLHLLGVPVKEIFHELSVARGLSVPDTAAQAEWVERFAGNRGT